MIIVSQFPLSYLWKTMRVKFTWCLLVIFGVVVIIWSLKRDIIIEKEFCGDLRNRVVGARLIKDGISPYFYKWKRGMTIRYYDPGNFNNTKPSCITASPFFLRMIIPLVELPQASISRIWLGIEYLILLSMVTLSFFLAKTVLQKQGVIFLTLVFLLTNAWKMHVADGQNYICIPFFALLFFYFVRKGKYIGYAWAAGAAATCLVLIKIYAVFFLVPFLFLIRSYSRPWLLAFFTPCLVALLWIFSSSRERGLWLDYKEQVTEFVAIFQGKGEAFVENDGPRPNLSKWEGIDLVAAAEVERNGPKRYYSENGNFYVPCLYIFHRFVPASLLYFASIVTIGSLLLIFYRLNRSSDGPDISQVAIFGFCLYMLADLFSPIIRNQYYATQWIFPLLIAAVTFDSRRRLPYLMILVGLLLSCIHLPFIKMGFTMGEYLILVALLVLSIFPGSKPKPLSE